MEYSNLIKQLSLLSLPRSSINLSPGRLNFFDLNVGQMVLFEGQKGIMSGKAELNECAFKLP